MRLEKSEDLDNVYKLFGICAHHCSNIEYRIAFLLQPTKWKKHRAHLDCKNQEMQKCDIKEWPAAMKRFEEALDNVGEDMDALYNVPLGNLIKQINDNYALSDDQKEYLRDILEKRNYVIHKMWGKYGRRLKDAQVIKDIKIITGVMENLDMDLLRKAVDLIKQKTDNAIIALGSKSVGRVLLVMGITRDLCEKGFNASVLIRDIAGVIGGSGGGRQDFAQAGGSKPENLELAFKKLNDIIANIK